MTTIFPFPPPNTQARGIIRDRSRSRRKRIRDCIIDPLYYCFWCSSNKKQQQNRRRNRRCLSSWSWILSLLGSILYFLALNRYLSTININDHHHPHHKLQILPQQQQKQHKQLEATDYLLPSQYSLRLGQQQQQQQQHIMSNNIRNNQTTTRYLIYRPPFEAAQGIGNLMNGLLAAHMLGEEYNRIVCVSDEWEEFLLAFDIVTPECHNRQEVSLLFMNNNDDGGGGGDHHHYYYHNKNKQMLWILNFGRLPINECKLRDQLQSPDISVLYLVANTYPQWPTAGNTLLNYNKNNSNQLFYRYYKPRKELINLLPWKEENPKQQQQPPNVVVHLRQPDDVKLDPRNGLDDESLQLLGEILPEDDTYLVTNQVDYYEYFNTNFGWSHPSWDIVTHSAKMDVIWTPPTTTSGNNQSKPTTAQSAATVTRSTQQQKHEQQILQVWSDWLTLYSANIVYHTSSDFSMSAIHWSGISESYTIQGTTSINRNIDNDDKKNEQGKHHRQQQQQQQQQRELILEPDRGGGGGGGHSSNTLPLSKRSIHSLQNCNLHPSGLDGLGYVLNLDDEYHDDELEDDWDLQKQQQQQLRRRPNPLVVQAAQHKNNKD